MEYTEVDFEAIEALALQLHRERSRFLRGLVGVRKAHGLTQSDVAERMGVSQPTVSEFEHYDANPRLDTILRYALAVDANVYLRAFEADSFRAGWTRVSRSGETTEFSCEFEVPRVWAEMSAA
ncbi:helix-turn-helix domain-containing protein [Schaalia sp. lx-260]|uniref:helix-turn-helix domain-containing protein n=1 Tax=Schaalia sp. lx-260 TaxID=2899082 RepID=UPI001E472D27|nr:helix-turn-helix transcriptional regulator [Schaalia sp. lx-260]MCD4549705.1 helix-turn-helix domain-containing protein [Schaalia sp. lx-260]